MKKILLQIFVLLFAISANAQNPLLLKDVFPGITGSGIQQIVKTSNYTFFNAEDDDADADRGLYRTDGTPAGTIKLNLDYRAVTPGYVSTKAEKLTGLGNKIIFAGDNFPNYGEIWSSDGTQAGTIALERFQPTQAGRVPVMNIAKLGTNVLYGVVDNNNHSLLKKTDGTVAGTTLIFDFSTILPGAPDLALFQEINGILYFNVYNIGGAGEDQLWRSDGTIAGTYLVKDFGLNQYVASGYMPAGTLFYLMIVTPGTGNVLWKSDGTDAGTAAVKTIGTTGNNNYPPNVAIGSTLYFAGLDGNGKELWKTDGTAAGTLMLADINTGAASSNPANLTVLNNKLYFSATTVAEGAELWKYDGGTASLIKDINTGTAGSSPGSLVVSNNTILFRALTATSGLELWITDGTTANTLQVADINPGVNNSTPNLLTPGNPVYFSANNGVAGAEIFKYDNADGLLGLHKLYVNDNSITGDLFTTAIGNNINPGTKTAPVATITYALSIAVAGDTIMVDAGTFIEQVTIDKGISIIGAGKDITFIIKPAATVPPPGSFTEKGLIQTAQGIADVHIKNLSVTGDYTTGVTPIIIQSGGSVKNCKLQNGNQGIFFRVETAIKTAVVENNIIDAEYIGVNCSGMNLTASIINNSISAVSPDFSAGIFAGLDFGALPQLTVTGNSISNFATYGLLISSTNATITQNSITGVSGLAIQQYNASTVIATCNWFGTADAEIIKSKISGAVNYTPWLVSGVDTNPVALGFQPAAATCIGRQNKFYVNDNSQTGDVFTTTVGNNSNNGFSTTPFATIDYAIGIAQAGDTIYVDGGTYTLASDLTINKAVTILGTNYNLSPNSAADKKLINPVRNAESIITNATLILGTSNISLQGLTFDPGIPIAVYFDTDLSNISVIRNRMIMTSSNAAVRFVGLGGSTTNTASLISANIIINENRFERFSASSGFAMNASLLKSISITDNSFVVTGTTLRNYTVFTSGAIGVNDAVLFSGNFVENALTVVTGNRNANLLITNNKIYNSNNALVMTNSMTESSTVELSNNTLVGSSGIVPFIQYNRSGGNTVGSSSVFKAENNTISGTAVAGTTTLLGSMNLIFQNGVLNPSLVVRNNTISYGGNFSSVQGQFIRPIMLRGNLLNAVVEKNEITLNGTNLQPANPLNVLPVSPAITLYSDNGTASVIPSGAVINILNNKIQGFKHSFIVFDPLNNGSNTFVGFGNLAAGITVNVNNNSFTDDSISINNGTTSQTINATCNWYGSSTAQNVSPKVTKTTVNHSPWLTSGIDNSTATGFQPIEGSCNGVPVNANIVLVTNVTCKDAANGAIDAFVQEGLAPFTFAWSKNSIPGFAATEDLNNLAPGFYELIVTDANGSVDTVFATITEPDILATSASGTNNICYGSSAGTAMVSVTGGTTPYTYLWSNNETTEDISGLAAGTYSVTVTDVNGCTTVSSYEVTQPSQLTALATGTSTSCSNNASVVASGGTSPYTYLWSNGATTMSIASIPAGTYLVTVTDNNGCTATASVSVTANEAFNPSASVTDVRCFGGSTGAITIKNVNAVAPFTFSIDGINFIAGNLPFTFSNLAAGTFSIAVKDANGCTGFVSKTVSQPPLLTVNLNNVQPACFGNNTGSVMITAAGGNGAISYSWVGNSGYASSQKNISNLAAGNFALTVTDNNGCTATLNVTVPSFNQINVGSVVKNIACKGEINGAIDLTVSGGTGSSFTFVWNTGATTEDIINLSVGNYSVTITDVGSGCVVSSSFTITQPSSTVSISTTKTNATGCGSMGTITATGSGGTAPYQYKLDAGAYQSPRSFINLPSGNYTLWIKDANGCTKSTVVSITDNGSDQYESNNSKSQAKVIIIASPINARIGTATDVDWFKFTTPAGNATYTLGVTHGSVNYTFNMYPSANNAAALVQVSSTSTSKSYSLLANSTYYIQVSGTLSLSCYNLAVNAVVTTLITKAESEKEKAPAVEVATLTSIAYPNPHKGSFNIMIASPEQGKARIELFNISGQKLAEKTVAVHKGNNNIVPFMSVQQQTIFYRISIGKYIANGKVMAIN